MFRVMLVDDEALALEGLALLIDWEKLGFLVTAQARSAMEALALLDEAAPDLIVTDIKMPNMNGLELIEKVKARGYQGCILVVSGYADFELARTALTLGVEGYLLKPVDLAESEATLTRVHATLETAQKEKQRRYHVALTQLMLGQNTDLSLFPREGTWTLIVWGAPLHFEQTLELTAIAQKQDVSSTIHIVDEREWMVLYSQDSSAQTASKAITRILHANGRDTLTCTTTQFPNGFVQACQSLNATLNDYIGALNEKTTAIVKAVVVLDRGKATLLAKELSRYCLLRGRQAQYDAWDMLCTACTRALCDKTDIAEELSQISIVKTSYETLVNNVINMLSPNEISVSETVIQYALAHSHQALTLEAIAVQLGYNAAYLGRIFQKEQSQSFHKWLTAHRIACAAQALRNKDDAIVKIAQEAGYLNVDVFRKHFKNQFGLNPDEYRRQSTLDAADVKADHEIPLQERVDNQDRHR